MGVVVHASRELIQTTEFDFTDVVRLNEHLGTVSGALLHRLQIGKIQ